MTIFKMADLRKTDQIVKDDGVICFGVSMPRNIVLEIDKIRGDIPRSMWLRRAGLRELHSMSAIPRNSAGAL
jgi:hypothetical protein